jgi:hypothetical protein
LLCHRATAAQKIFQLLNRPQLLFIHVDHHPSTINPIPFLPPNFDLQAHSSLENRYITQAHTSLDKAVAGQRWDLIVAMDGVWQAMTPSGKEKAGVYVL